MLIFLTLEAFEWRKIIDIKRNIIKRIIRKSLYIPEINGYISSATVKNIDGSSGVVDFYPFSEQDFGTILFQVNNMNRLLSQIDYQCCQGVNGAITLCTKIKELILHYQEMKKKYYML
jgi:hypothetical protein